MTSMGRQAWGRSARGGYLLLNSAHNQRTSPSAYVWPVVAQERALTGPLRPKGHRYAPIAVLH